MALTTKEKRLKQENQRYWRRREQEALQHQKLRAKAETYDDHIRRTLEHTLEQVQKEIDAFYRKYATKEGISIEEAKRRASNMDIEAFAAKAKEYVDTKDFSDEANEALRLYNLTMKVNRLELLKAQIGLDMIDDFNELQKFFGDELTEDTLAELRRQAGILGETVIDPAGKASEIVNGSWYNARFSERIWLQQDLLRFQLEGLLTDGILQGKNPRVLARELKKKFNTTTYNCQRLMRTELARVQIGAQQAEYEENDVEEFEFIANSTACPICAALDGKHFKVKDLVIAKNAPPMHPNCMCSTAPWEDGFGDLPPEERAPEADGPAEPENESNKDLTARRKARQAARKNLNNIDIEFDNKISKNQADIIERLSNIYITRLKRVERGNAIKDAAQGITTNFGQLIRLSSESVQTAIHEFAHSIASTGSEKVGLTSNKEFWQEIRNIKREYQRKINKGEITTKDWISSYEQGDRSIDEFFAEAFTLALCRKWKIPTKNFGSDTIYSGKVLAVVDKYFSRKNGKYSRNEV